MRYTHCAITDEENEGAMDNAPARSRGRLAIWAAIAVAILLVLSFARTDLGTRALRAVGVSSPPTPYVELFFDERGALPPTLPSGVPVTVPVGFVLGNGASEGRPVVWSVTQSPPAGTGNHSEGIARLGVGERRVVQTKLAVRCVGPSIQLTVQVVDGAALITHAIRCTPGRAR